MLSVLIGICAAWAVVSIPLGLYLGRLLYRSRPPTPPQHG